MTDEDWDLEKYQEPIAGEQKIGPSGTAEFNAALGEPQLLKVTPEGREYDGLTPEPGDEVG